MSAIAGILHFNNELIPDSHCKGLMEALEKYPADDIQLWKNRNIFLGCHAQWITPESVGEQLPHYDYEKQLAITADAIIDNREELFEKLGVKYEDRKIMPDSQLILLAYVKWGEDSPKHLIGDFAFMIWDERKNQLFGARDFSGSRTLYYYHNGQQFVFCTTIMPFFYLPYLKKELNEEWLAGFIAVPDMTDEVNGELTVYKNIVQLPPAHSIVIHNMKGISVSRFCNLIPDKKLNLKSSAAYEEAFCEIFQQAVSEKSRTFKKVGARLSGGLDSGSVAGFAAPTLKKNNKTLFTYSYVPVKSFVDWTPKSRIANETPYIKSTVKYVENIEDYYLDFEGKSPLTEIDTLLETMEMPYKFFENSFWLNGIYEKARNDGVGILLNGERGNYTISWGPALDYYATLLKRFKWIKLYKEAHKFSINNRSGRKLTLQQVGQKAFPFVKKFNNSENECGFPMMINPSFAQRTGIFDKVQRLGKDVTGTQLPSIYKSKKQQFDNVFSWNINGTVGTKQSLKYCLWDRDPTNDLRIVKFCLLVPENQYVQNGIDRALIRRSTKNYLPDNVRMNFQTRGIQGSDGIHRMKDSWNIFVNEIDQLCKDSIVSNILNIPEIKKALSNMRENVQNNSVYEFDFKVLMRSLIVYRFIKNHA